MVFRHGRGIERGSGSGLMKSGSRRLASNKSKAKVQFELRDPFAYVIQEKRAVAREGPQYSYEARLEPTLQRYG